ncbi:MAG: hypothetical protein Q8800_01870, partial [Candidatus Phytoplasma australasiaticum]|nr:hypothetical protein [Candidatus Phytoplasma australasiaticum]
MFITFEGGDGVGKTTHVLSLFKTIKTKYPVMMTREPGGDGVVKTVKQIVIERRSARLTASQTRVWGVGG